MDCFSTWKHSRSFVTLWQQLRHVNLTIISLFCISQWGKCHFEVKLWTTHKYGCLWQLTFLILRPVNVSYVKKYWYFLLFDCIWDTSIWPSSLCFVFDNWDNAILKPTWIFFLLQLFSRKLLKRCVSFKVYHFLHHCKHSPSRRFWSQSVWKSSKQKLIHTVFCQFYNKIKK